MLPANATLATRTTTKLLDALRNEDNEPVWTQFDARYRPVIAGLARRLGLGSGDAEEAAQQTLSEFVRSYREGRYERSKGRLSSWLLGIARHTAIRMQRAQRSLPDAQGLAEVVAESALRPIWEEERDREILMHAIVKLHQESAVEARTLQAFELTALRGVPASEAALQCRMSVEQVYVAKSRLTKRLRALVDAMTAAFEEDA